MGDRSCAAIIEKGRILMVRQTYRGQTFWTLPGGRIEPSESPLQCAIRETKEETGLEIAVLEKICERFSDRINGVYHCYLGKVIGGVAELGTDPELPATLQELHELRWFPVEEMASHPEVGHIRAFLQNHIP